MPHVYPILYCTLLLEFVCSVSADAGCRSVHVRFVVPEGSFSAVVNVSKCVEAGGGGPCPLTLSASPLALPTDGGPLAR